MLLSVVLNEAGVTTGLRTEANEVVEIHALSLTGAMTWAVRRPRSRGKEKGASRGEQGARGANGGTWRVLQAAARGRQLQINVDDCWWFLRV